MKRDLDLIRTILLQVEEKDRRFSPEEVEGHSLEKVDYHLVLLLEAGLIGGSKFSNGFVSSSVLVTQLTWSGHDFLDAARNKSIWEKAKKYVAAKLKLDSVPLEVIKGVLIRELTSALSDGFN